MGRAEQSGGRHHASVGGLARASVDSVAGVGRAALLVVHVFLRAVHRVFLHHGHFTQAMGGIRTPRVSLGATAHLDDSGHGGRADRVPQKQIVLGRVRHRLVHFDLEYPAPVLAQPALSAHWPHLSHHDLIWTRFPAASNQVQLCHGGFWVSHQPRSPALRVVVPCVVAD